MKRDDDPLRLVVAVSVGWIFPLYASQQLLFSWCRLYVDAGVPRELQSFPYLEASHQMLAIALTWLGLVAAGWSFAAARRWLWADEAN